MRNAISITFILSCLHPATGYGQAANDREFARYDPAKIVQAEACGECHQSEYRVWKATQHAAGFKTLHRKKRAEDIAERMGFKLIKRESLCLKCHYTTQVKNGQRKAVSGVSCESCHGAAADWINVHNDHGKGQNYKTETPEHKSKRIADSKAAGMFRPSELYEVAANCFQCHAVPHEKLVNVGGHTSGSSNFELVDRVESIRHNFLGAQFDPSKTDNVERSQAHKRVLFVVGLAVDLEYSIRGAAVSTKEGPYLSSMLKRIRSAGRKLEASYSVAPVDEIADILTVRRRAKVSYNAGPSLLRVADEIRSSTKRFIARHDGSQLAGLDPLMAGGVTASATTDTQQSTGIPPAASGTLDRKSGAAAAPGYAKKNSLRPRTGHETLGDGCSCHREENSWLISDRHSSSLEPFLARAPKNIKIARLYGLSPNEILKGNRICMDCHGTVVSGEEGFDVADGVGCESCHGPAADYLKPHAKEGNGYAVGKDLGMALLSDLKVHARKCAECHYITDQRLISTGHPTGKNYDFASGNVKVKHWKNPLPSEAALSAAFQQAKQERGAIPNVTFVSESSLPPVQASQSSSVAPTPPPVRPAGYLNRSSGRQITLPPFPSISDSLSIEETLLLLQKRLELLYQKVGE